jgi:NADP-dependent 3-hydroxy acid dehydrogenase YdfG
MYRLLKDKWVLITGASSGFGAAAAVEYARAGAKLLLGARRMDRLAEVADKALKSGAPQAHIQALDVRSTSSVNGFAAFAREKAAAVHVLINNAGGARGLDSVAQGRDEDWEFMLDTNVLGILRMTRAVLPLMPQHSGAFILNIGSIAGRTAYEGGAAYCAAKAGELQVTRTLRLELNGTGIRVGTLDVGYAETEFSIVRFGGDRQRAAKVYEGMKPLTAQDVAEIMVWMTSRPDHVNMDEVLVKPVDQAAIYKVHRRR